MEADYRTSRKRATVTDTPKTATMRGKLNLDNAIPTIDGVHVIANLLWQFRDEDVEIIVRKVEVEGSREMAGKLKEMEK